MSRLNTLESVEIELNKIRKAASRLEDELILYLIDMTILAVKRKAVSECTAFAASPGRTPSQQRGLPRQ